MGGEVGVFVPPRFKAELCKSGIEAGGCVAAGLRPIRKLLFFAIAEERAAAVGGWRLRRAARCNSRSLSTCFMSTIYRSVSELLVLKWSVHAQPRQAREKLDPHLTTFSPQAGGRPKCQHSIEDGRVLVYITETLGRKLWARGRQTIGIAQSRGCQGQGRSHGRLNVRRNGRQG